MPDTLQTPGATDWFIHDRFGLFIHWGLYALPARHEWVKSRERIGSDAYDRKYFDRFDPDLYDPDRWAQAAANAGMKYFVITTKHHDGFCLWDSELTDYKAPNTPAGRDLLTPMVEAFGNHGLRPGFYHSLIDWRHDQYIIDNKNHPRRAELDVASEADGMLAQAGGETAAGGAAGNGKNPNAGRDHQKYIAYLHGQVRELLTKYSPDILWFDFSFGDESDRRAGKLHLAKGREAWGSEQLYPMIRELAPDIILNDRLDLPSGGGWDVKTPEQVQPRSWVHVEHEGQQVPVVWEACQTMSGSWGYHRDENTFRSTRQLITTLIDSVSKGGNLLLNVGPTGRGEIDHRAMSRLEGIGRWMHWHSRSIYGCTQAPDEFKTPQDCRLTYDPQKHRLYVHLLEWPYKFVNLVGEAFVERVEYAQLLHDASEVRGLKAGSWHANQLGLKADTLTLELPQTEPEGVEVPVLELFLKH